MSEEERKEVERLARYYLDKYNKPGEDQNEG